MRHGIAKLSVALTALICITAATATIAQAAEGPRWKLDNKYLTAGETRRLTPAPATLPCPLNLSVDMPHSHAPNNHTKKHRLAARASVTQAPSKLPRISRAAQSPATAAANAV